MKKIRVLYRAYMTNALDNKFVFLFSLLLPFAVFVQNNAGLIFSPKHNQQINLSQLLEDRGMPFFWAFIIFNVILSSIIMGAILERESGFYKEYYFIVGSKWQLIFVDYLVHMTIVLAEIMIFNLLVMLSLRIWSWALIFSAILAVLLLSIPATLFSCLLLSIRVKIQTMNIFNFVLTAAIFYLATFSGRGFWLNLLLLINPMKYLAVGSSFLTNCFLGRLDSSILLQIVLVTILYILVGMWSLPRFKVQPILRRA